MTYRVELDVYNGPLDLLLYLIRREEVDVREVSLARIADQYLAYIEMLKSLDVDLAGDFLVMASTLLEIKSRTLLPRPPAAEEDDVLEAEEDPRETLIRQLIEYRRFKEAAALLDDRCRDMSRRYPRQFDERLAADLEDGAGGDTPDDLFKGVEIWDLISAFGQVMRTLGYSEPREVIYDDTPVEEAGQELLKILEQQRCVLFSQLFSRGRSLNYCVTMFLAVLELIRQRRVAVEQETDFKDFRLYLRDSAADLPAQPVDPMGAELSREAIERSRPRRPTARQVDQLHDMMDEADLEKTEFDEILESVRIPEVEVERPAYTDEELMGRPADGDVASPESQAGRVPSAEQDKPQEQPPATENQVAPAEP